MIIVLIIIDFCVSTVAAFTLWEPQQCSRCETSYYADGMNAMHTAVHYCKECREANKHGHGWSTIWWIVFLIGLVISLLITK